MYHPLSGRPVHPAAIFTPQSLPHRAYDDYKEVFEETMRKFGVVSSARQANHVRTMQVELSRLNDNMK